MRIYNYHFQTGEFTGEDDADPDLLEPGAFIIPAYATTKAPPELETGQRAVFDRERDDWVADSGPPPTPLTFAEKLGQIPFSLLGGETIGDLFDGQ
jgi:hypothetical protein